MDELKIIELSLSQNRDTILRITGIEKDEFYQQVQNYIRANTAQWQEDRPNIDYSNPICRLAYIYMNVPMHSFLIETFLSKCSRVILDEFREQNHSLNICAFGGGPGSELIGLCCFLLNADDANQYELDFLLIDLVKEWDEFWHSVKNCFDGYQRNRFGLKKNWPLSINRSFIPLNALNLQEFKNFSIRISGIHLFTFSYIVSEVFFDMENFLNVLKYLVEISNPGTLFLFVDRDQSPIRSRLLRFLFEHGLTVIQNEDHCRGKANFPLQELGEWYLRLESLPRQTYQAFYILAKKEIISHEN